MRAITVLPSVANSVRLEDVPEPPESDGALLVRTWALGVCGTDREIVSGAYGSAPAGHQRLVLGHESLGEVEAAPKGGNVKAGDLVVGIVRRPDPLPCPACAAGEWDMCRNGRYTERGIKDRHGFGAERFRLEPEFAVKVDPALGGLAVLLEPASIVAKAWDHTEGIGRRSRAWKPRSLLVTGAGSIGLLAALMGAQRGLEVHVLDHNDNGLKRPLAEDLGGHFHVGSLADFADLDPDILMECTGIPNVIRDVLGVTAPAGIVCLLGVTEPGHKRPLDIGRLNRTLVLDNDTVFGAVNANRLHYEQAAVALAQADQGWLSRLITRRVPLDRWGEALERRPGDIKVVIDFARPVTSRMSSRIEDYALIGDCEAAALVGRDGSIDWLCWPRFDSEACFAALLGSEEHGRWLIAPRDSGARVRRRYRGDTLILETRFETGEGIVTLVDFMPLRDRCSNLVRLLVGERGRVAMRTELVLRFGYGAIVPWVSRLDDGALRAVAGPDMVTLRTPIALVGQNMRTVGEFSVAAGETVPFVLSYAPSHTPAPEPLDHLSALAATEEFWIEWSRKCRPAGHCSEPVKRSLVTLKALTYAPTGGIVAAPTTSLPEQLGGIRNWDYRFCWLRDATLTLLALMDAGFYEEAQSWRDWLLRAVAGSPEQVQIMYGIAGERRLTEWEVPWLPGYEGARPVRIGNGAHGQLQLDVFGEVMDALHQARRSGLAAGESGWALQQAFLAHLENVWTEPDQGIWEIRGGARHFTYSKVMAWVAFDRAIKSAEEFKLDGPLDRWRALAAEIHADVCARGFDAELGSFVQSYGSRQLDASLLLLPEVGFLPADDPRVRGTLRAIEQRLLIDGFVMRYDTERSSDGLPPGEGAFLACSFWLVDAYILQNRWDDARRLFDRLLALRNDLGLLSEEYDQHAGRLVGNFPQAFTHVALVNSAFNLTRDEKPVQQRSQPERQETAVTAEA